MQWQEKDIARSQTNKIKCRRRRPWVCLCRGELIVCSCCFRMVILIVSVSRALFGVRLSAVNDMWLLVVVVDEKILCGGTHMYVGGTTRVFLRGIFERGLPQDSKNISTLAGIDARFSFDTTTTKKEVLTWLERPWVCSVAFVLTLIIGLIFSSKSIRIALSVSLSLISRVVPASFWCGVALLFWFFL